MNWTIEIDRDNPGMVRWERRYIQEWNGVKSASKILVDAIELFIQDLDAQILAHYTE